MAYFSLQASCMDTSPAVLPMDRQSFRNGMARLASAVNIITSVGDEGRCGFTASAVCSVTDTPPTLLVCINKSSQSYGAITKSRILCVNTATSTHKELSMLFSGSTKNMETRFAGGTWTTLLTGAPVLVDAAVAFDCRITSVTEVGTHDVLFCEVLAIHENSEPEGLVYFGRKFHRVL